MGWQRLGSEIVHRGPVLTVRRDAVRLPDGTAGVYEHVSVDDGVRVVALDADGQVVLVEDDFYLQRRRMLHLPGGGTDGENPYRAALRELEEETGLTAAHVDTLGVIDPLPGLTTARTHLMLATDLRPGTMRRDGAEAGMTVHRRPLPDAVAAVRTGEITDAASATALLLASQAR
ncbi:NUDIX hydrolase [Streptomyces sp. NBC_01716]|uniref:NUDIX hydrolase n=1 Tax=Streptomyces sp. NBC_01716 TaxID=2975917 RepID=UPI002E302685|nr:NUDIX hydrolase [Streptomyces sp. NBC_01716]